MTIVCCYDAHFPRSHEVAYIFGQLSSPYSIPSLLRVMRDQQEDDMVRHEAAEALGGIASDGVDEGEGSEELSEEDRKKGVLGILREWAKKEEAPMVVRESCQVAVDMFEVSAHLGRVTRVTNAWLGSTKTRTNSSTQTSLPLAARRMVHRRLGRV